MEFVCYDEWSQLPESADALFAQAAKDSIFFSRPWFENLIRHSPELRQNILLACVVEGGNVLAILPLEMRSSEHWYALTNLYSSLYTLLLDAHRSREVAECLAQGLVRLRFSHLRLDPVAEDDRNLRYLEQAMGALGISCQRRFRFYNWIHRTRGQSFAEYLQARPTRVRNTIARKARKLERERGYTIRLFADGDVRQAVNDYNAVYNKSWKANELYGGFIQGLAARLAQEGWLRLAVLYIEGKPAAAQFWFVVQGRASIFKLAYDEAWKHYSPGSILTCYLMEQVIDSDKVSEIDFLTGNDSYKQDWMSERRERCSLSFINNPKSGARAGRLFTWLRKLI